MGCDVTALEKQQTRAELCAVATFIPFDQEVNMLKIHKRSTEVLPPSNACQEQK